MSENLFNIEGLTVNNIVADKIKAKHIEIIKDGSGDSGGGASSSKSIFGEEVKVNNRTYKDHMLKVAEDGTITNSNSIAIVSKDGTEDNVITHKNPAGINASPFIAIESADNGASLILKDYSDLAFNTYSERGGFELNGGNASIKSYESGSILFNDFLKINGNGDIIVIPNDNKKFIDIGFPYAEKSGALLALRSVDYTENPGCFGLYAKNADSQSVLRGAPDGSLSWNDKHVIRLVESKRNGANWYRKYSDGFIEQGGLTGKINIDNSTTITLTGPFTTTNYYVNFIVISGTTDGTHMHGVSAKTTTTFTARTYLFNDVPVAWYACGY